MHFQEKIASSINSDLPMLGIIAGGGYVPYELAKIYVKYGGECCIAAIEDEADYELFQGYNIRKLKIGNLKAVIEYFREANITNVIFAGKVTRPNLSAIKVDLLGSILLARILKRKFLGDDQVLRVVAEFFEEKGFNVISAKDILDYADNHERLNLSKNIPSKKDLNDIEIGKKVIETLGPLDIGQAVIVDDGYVIGVEAAEGTDELIKRCADLRKKSGGGVLVKMMKKTQDFRMDIPTIGPDTLSNIAKFHYRGVAIDSSSVIIVRPEVTTEIANKNKIYIYYL